MITLENEELQVTINPYGGMIEEIYNKKRNTDHFWKYDQSFWKRRTSVCFPICGGLIDNKYYCDGKEYSLPMHGFLRESMMSVKFADNRVACLSMESSPSTKLEYPFDFLLNINFSIELNELKIVYKVKNTDKRDMLFSIGAHYTYNLPDAMNSCMYCFSKPQNARSFTQDNGIIGIQESKICFTDRYLPMDHLFDVASKIYKVDELNTDYIAICDEKGIFTKVSFSGFSYVVLWAPKGNNSPFACIEPWAGMADFQGHDQQLETKEGIERLGPGEEKEYEQIITVY